MSRKFWLQNMTLHKSPGFASGTFPPIETLGENLNVIWGPNAVGKSTLSRAMRALIWNGRTDTPIEAEALLKGPDSDWILSLAQGRLKQTRLSDNQELPLPGRNDELSESYWFTLHELLQEDPRHTDTFLRQVRNSMQGGVDLDAALTDAGGISSFSSASISEARNARGAIEEHKKILRFQQEHQDIQDRIERLQQDVNQSEELSLKRALLEDALSLQATVQSIEEDTLALSAYPPAIGQIDKSSPTRLEELLASQTKAQKEVTASLEARASLQRDFDACAIEDVQLADREKPNRVANQFEAYKEALATQSSCLKEFESLHQQLKEWEAQHSWLRAEPSEDSTLEGYVLTLKKLAQECEPLRCAFDASKRLYDELGPPEEVVHTTQDLAKLQLRLIGWLEAFWKLQGTSRNKPLLPGTKKLLLLWMLVIGGISTWLGMAFQPLWYAVGVMLMFGSVALILPSPTKNTQFKKAEEALAQAKEDSEKLFAQLGRKRPNEWTPESCQALYWGLQAEIATMQRIEGTNQRRSVAKGKLEEATGKLKDWTEAWHSAVIELGLTEGEARLEGAQFFHFAERLQKWSEYRLEFVKSEQALSVAREEVRGALALIQAELATTESEPTSLKAKADSLRERFTNALSLQAKLLENVGRVEQGREELESIEVAIREFWEKTGLAFGDEALLGELVSQLDTWNALNLNKKYKQGQYEKKCKESPEAYELSLAREEVGLTSELAELIHEQQALEGKREELGGLRATFDALKFGSALSEAELKEDLAIAELEEYRKQQVHDRMISSLATQLRQESEEQFQPQVLKKASEWLADITRHRYTLSLNKDGFFATDTIVAKNYKLDELSSGTRIQLLFSIRMAFITMQEETSGVKLPIFLDELLANSDDDRALAIAEAIGSIAKQRQVFYVTAQRDEVEKLKAIATCDVTVIPLEDLRRELSISKEPLKPYAYTRRQVPPAQADYHAYGQALFVAGPSLWQSIEALHSWHLLGDSDELYGYLKKGLDHIGQLISSEGIKNSSLSFRLELLKSAQRQAQKGRARRVHLSDLDDPLLDLKRNVKYWEQLQGVVGLQGATGSELLAAVDEKRIQRFTEANLEVLSSWLFENKFATNEKSKPKQAILEDLFVEFEELSVGSADEEIVGRYLEAVIG